MSATVTVRHPTLKELPRRDRLLETAMREHKVDFAIAAEYPLVLTPQTIPYSYGAWKEDQFLGHANLFPRSLTLSEGALPIALIGNVATVPKLRGKGYASDLIKQLMGKAESEGARAVFLWSDLPQFYQRLGFEPHGEECRFVIPRGATALPASATSPNWARAHEAKLSDAELLRMMDLRPRVSATIQRSLEEMRLLLRIPQTNIFTKRREDGELDAFLIIGRGSDLQGVIHEWGAQSGEQIAYGVQLICRSYNLESMTLLAPAHMDGKYLMPLKEMCENCDIHPIALVHCFEEGLRERPDFQRIFVWGLDSI